MNRFQHASLQSFPPFRARDDVVAPDAALAVTARDLIDMAASAGALQPLQSLTARARRAGGHLSRTRGRGMDYAESRAYQSGDDIRVMDWRVTARAVEPHIKLFREERERPVVAAIDLNPGMFFASRGALKAVQAARAAALFGWAAVTQGDRIGALLFDHDHHEVPPRSGRSGILSVIRELVAHTDARSALQLAPDPEGFNRALLRLRRLVRPGSLVILISDFYGLDELSMPHLLYLRRHSEVIALRVLDELELHAPPSGRYGVTDGRARHDIETVTPRDRARYQEALAAHHAAVQQRLQRCGIALLQLTTEDTVGQAITSQLNTAPGQYRRAV